eukprot:2040550-Rhodomonas_salina.4
MGHGDGGEPQPQAATHTNSDAVTGRAVPSPAPAAAGSGSMRVAPPLRRAVLSVVYHAELERGTQVACPSQSFAFATQCPVLTQDPPFRGSQTQHAWAEAATLPSSGCIHWIRSECSALISFLPPPGAAASLASAAGCRWL